MASSTIPIVSAGFAFIAGVPQYSAGVVALPGFEIHRARLATPLEMQAGFAAIESHLDSLGLSKTSLCACEMRSPAPFTEQGFLELNQYYIGILRDWGVLYEGHNPVARSNVCPEFEPPDSPSISSFSYVVKSTDASKSFVIAGSGEVPEGKSNYQDHIIRPGETSADAIAEKTEWVLGEMERRLDAVEADWADTTMVQLYTVHDFVAAARAHMAKRGVLRNGLTWYCNRPPIAGLEVEMDCRRIRHESVLEV